MLLFVVCCSLAVAVGVVRRRFALVVCCSDALLCGVGCCCLVMASVPLFVVWSVIVC